MSSNVYFDRAYEYLRTRILGGEYWPGQHLMAKALSAELKLSPTPVRDAMRQLEADGLVTIRPRPESFFFTPPGFDREGALEGVLRHSPNSGNAWPA